MLVITTSILPSLLLGMVFTDLPYHLIVIQGLPDLFMGALIMVMGIAVIVASPPRGAAADRYGRKRILIISNIVMSGSIILFAIVRNLLILLIVAAVKGICEAVFLADRIIILSRRPGTIREILTIPGERLLERTGEQFVQIPRPLLDIINEDSAAGL